MLNVGLVFACTGATVALMAEFLDAKGNTRVPKEWFAIAGLSLAAIGTGLGSFGVSSAGDGVVAYIPTMVLGVLLVAAFVVFLALGRTFPMPEATENVGAGGSPACAEDEHRDSRARRSVPPNK